jgi:hypothetical protein
MYIYLYIYICIFYIFIYVHIYKLGAALGDLLQLHNTSVSMIQEEFIPELSKSNGDEDRNNLGGKCIYIYMYICICIYIYIYI